MRCWDPYGERHPSADQPWWLTPRNVVWFERVCEPLRSIAIQQLWEDVLNFENNLLHTVTWRCNMDIDRKGVPNPMPPMPFFKTKRHPKTAWHRQKGQDAESLGLGAKGMDRPFVFLSKTGHWKNERLDFSYEHIFETFFCTKMFLQILLLLSLFFVKKVGGFVFTELLFPSEIWHDQHKWTIYFSTQQTTNQFCSDVFFRDLVRSYPKESTFWSSQIGEDTLSSAAPSFFFSWGEKRPENHTKCINMHQNIIWFLDVFGRLFVSS